MRRLAFAVACGTLLLAACSDQPRSPTEPSAPLPEANLGTCRPVKFPIVKVSVLILKVFPAGKLRLEALARAAAITLLWDTCRRAPAQKAAIAFIDWMNLNSARLIGTQDQRTTLTNLILNGVGVPGSIPGGSPGDFGLGFFDPASNQPLVVKTISKVALTEIPAHSFAQAMVIRVFRNLDNFELTDFTGDQFPPSWDYDAIRSTGITSNADHILLNNNKATIIFCLLNTDFADYPEDFSRLRIGHNPVPGAPGFPFEILLEQVDRPDLVAALNCPNLAPNPGIGPIGSFGGVLPDLALAAGRQAGRYIGPIIRALFLPDAVQAMTLGTLPPPINGRAPSLSPFGVVDATPDFTVQNSGETDPVGGTFTAGQPIDLCSGDSCGPKFRIDNGDGSESGTIIATLIPIDGSTGTLSGTTSETATGDPEPSPAEFDNLIVSAAGTYQLKFAAANSVPYVTGTFRVASAGVTQLACNQEGTVRSLESNKAVQLEFTNNTSVPVAVYWLNFDGVREYPFAEGSGIGMPYTVLAPGASYIQETYVTHPWLLESDDETATCYGIFLPGTEDGEVVVP